MLRKKQQHFAFPIFCCHQKVLALFLLSLCTARNFYSHVFCVPVTSPHASNRIEPSASHLSPPHLQDRKPRIGIIFWTSTNADAVRRYTALHSKDALWSFVGLWPVQFYSGSPGASLLQSDSDLADWRTKQYRYPALDTALTECVCPPALLGVSLVQTLQIGTITVLWQCGAFGCLHRGFCSERRNF